MNDQVLEKLLNGVTTPRVGEQAKKRAIELALVAFDETIKVRSSALENKWGFFGQGFPGWLRPTRTEQTKPRRDAMKFTRNKLILGGLATASIAVIGVLMFPRYTGVGGSEKDGFGPMSSIDFRRSTPSEIPPADSGKETAGGQGDPTRESIVTAARPVEQGAVSAPITQTPSDADLVGKITEGGESKPQSWTTGAETDDSASAAPEPPLAGAKPAVIAAAPPTPSSNVNATPAPERVRANLRGFGGTVAATDSRSQVQPGTPSLAPPGDAPDPVSYRDEGRDRFENFEINPIKLVGEEPVSTFSVDVDTSSYSFVRRQLNNGLLPQKDAVRLEEMINYFDYDYPLPESKEIPFKASVAVLDSPWNPGKKLVHIGIQGYDIDANSRPRTNLVFLLDVSGSMDSPDKLPLVKQSMSLLLSSLQPQDTVGIVVYAGAAGKILDPTAVQDKDKILAALNRLEAGGSTAGAQGIKLAYQLAQANFDKKAINRIVLATDGDFNVGITNPDELQGFVERNKEQGIFLSVLGFGEGNYYDQMMQVLAQNGNGVAAYIDTLSEAQKVLVDEATSTLFPIAKDVKIQVEFNPATVAEYRLLGYETRHLNREDFNNDAVDAGDIGAGHTVTAIYEITPVGSNARLINDSHYDQQQEIKKPGSADEYAFLKIRYKLPDATESKLISQAIAVRKSDSQENRATREAEFASAVAGFAQLLKGGRYTGKLTFDDIIEQALRSKGEDKFGYRAEFIQLVRKAKVAHGM